MPICIQYMFSRQQQKTTIITHHRRNWGKELRTVPLTRRVYPSVRTAAWTSGSVAVSSSDLAQTCLPLFFWGGLRGMISDEPPELEYPHAGLTLIMLCRNQQRPASGESAHCKELLELFERDMRPSRAVPCNAEHIAAFMRTLSSPSTSLSSLPRRTQFRLRTKPRARPSLDLPL